MAPSSIPAYVNLADVYRALGRDADGERVLRDGLASAPKSGVLHFALGLALTRLNRGDTALREFARAAGLEPGNARFAYVHAIALHSSGKVDAAIAQLKAALTTHPANGDIISPRSPSSTRRAARRAEAERYATSCGLAPIGKRDVATSQSSAPRNRRSKVQCSSRVARPLIHRARHAFRHIVVLANARHVVSCVSGVALRVSQLYALFAVVALAGASAVAQTPAEQAQHPVHHGRRHRLDAAEHLPSGPDGRRNAQHRSHRQEGAKFMTYYAEQSCTAGRNAFFTGMTPLRTGMIPPQLPGSPSYLRPGTPALAKFLLDLGYTTGEFGKNHLGDHTDALPTAHGFQEFWGYLYHLDAMEQVSFPDINKSPTKQGFAPPCKNTPIPGLPEVPGAVDPKTTICLTPPRPVSGASPPTARRRIRPARTRAR